MNHRFASVLVLAAAAVSLAACGSPTVGSATDTPTTGSGPTGLGTATSSSSAPGSNGGSALSSVQPCSLLSSSAQAQLQVQPVGPSSAITLPNCGWMRPVDINGNNGFSLNATIRASQSLDSVNTAGYVVTGSSTGGHQIKQLKSTISPDCIVSIGVGSSARVDVAVSGDSDADAACQVADQAAQAIAPELPAS